MGVMLASKYSLKAIGNLRDILKFRNLRVESRVSDVRAG
jgi:hypothetical protein